MVAVREELRQRRRQQGFTQEALAYTIGVAPTTYREWERGATSPRVGFRPRLARALDVSLAEAHRLLDGDGRAHAPDGFEVPAWLGHLAALEQGASQLWAYEPVVVPGLLQTAAYATAVERAVPESISDAEVARRVDARLARQHVLDRQPDPLELSVVLDESALYRVAGSPEVMAEQLGHLAEAGARPNIDLRVLPLTAGCFAAAFGSFIVLTSPGSAEPFMACVEDQAGARYLDRAPEVSGHIRLYEYLCHRALPATATHDLIRTIAQERYP